MSRNRLESLTPFASSSEPSALQGAFGPTVVDGDNSGSFITDSGTATPIILQNRKTVKHLVPFDSAF